MMLLLLLVTVVLLLFCLTVFRRATPPAAIHRRTIKIRDAAVARRALIDHADDFSDRPAALFVVPLVTGRRRRRSDNILSAPYGPLWRALRCNLTVELLHPTRLGSIEPLQRAAVEALVAEVATKARSRAGEVVVVRDSVRAAVFPLVARLCFGDGLGDRQLLALQRLMEDFVVAIGKANKFPGTSRVARILHWVQLRRLAAFRGRQLECFLRLIAARRKRQTRRGSDGGLIRPYVDTLLDLRVPCSVADLPDDTDGEEKEERHSRRTLTDDEMVSLVSEFLGAGTETVVSCVEWTLAHLVIQPEVQDKLRREVIIDGNDDHRRAVTSYLRRDSREPPAAPAGATSHALRPRPCRPAGRRDRHLVAHGRRQGALHGARHRA
uniref:Cytochrome P450 n=1 Tax=Oryza brachyantha TaxID=4533 RepID=A0A0U1WXN5_ORYBR|nr:cytochrome P450 [Oryza brachyantha]